MTTNLRIGLTCVLWFLATMGSPLHAGDAANSPVGMWKLVPTPNSTYEPILTLQLEGNTLTGTLTRNTGDHIEELVIEDGSIQGDVISFTTHFYVPYYVRGVLQPADTNWMSHWRFSGTVNGDLMQGKVVKESAAGLRTQHWEARRMTGS